MKISQLKKILSFGIVSFSIISGCQANASASRPKSIVAITQIVPHPSLNLIRQGIEDELAEQQVDCDILFENAQGSMVTATQIAQKFVSQKPTIIIPITTPSTQTVYAAATPQKIPVVFAAVNDPVSANLVPERDKAGNGITGVSDMPPVADQVTLIQKILPHAKTIGVIYNPGEGNSVAVLENLARELAQKGMTLVKATAATMVDVAGSANFLVGQGVDAIYIPNDNTVVAALDSLLKVAANRVAVFSADPESVKQGCLAAVSHSQYGLGRQTGKMVAKVLAGADIQALPVEVPGEVELSLNQDTAQALGIVFPQAVIAQANSIIIKQEKTYGPSS